MHLKVLTLCFVLGVAWVSDVRGLIHDIRLSDGPTSTEGRVEVFVDKSWGSVCDEEWSVEDATVLCRQRGCERAKEATKGSKYGPGILDMKISRVRCVGTEKDLLYQCLYHRLTPTENTTCSNSTEAGAVCMCGITVSIGEENTGMGVVMVTLSDGSHGGLCYSEFNQPVADVACREAGFMMGAASISDIETDRLLNVSYTCDGTEISLAACAQENVNSSHCADQKAAAVICKGQEHISSPEPTEDIPPHGLSTGAIVGIVIGVLIGIVLIIGIALCVCKTRRDGPASI